MTLKELKATELEIIAKNGKVSISARGNNRAIAVILGEIIARIGGEKTKALLSDTALAALLYNED